MKFRKLLGTLELLTVCSAACMGLGIADTDAAGKKAGIAISAESFPDAGFRAIVTKQADADRNGFLSETEIQNITKMDIIIPHQKGHAGSGAAKKDVFNYIDKPYVYDGKAMDFTGMENFYNLKKIRMHNVKPSNIPFKKLQKLKVFEISSAPEMTIDVSDVPNLDALVVAMTDLKRIGLEKNTSLKRICMYHSKLRSRNLDLSVNKQLKEIKLYSAGIDQVNLGKNDRLRELGISKSSLKDVDLSGCKNLERVVLTGSRLKSLDVSNNKKLRVLTVDANALKKLDISGNSRLEQLSISANPFVKIDSSTLIVSDDCALPVLLAENMGKCTKVDVSHIPALQSVYARAGIYKSMKVGKEVQDVYMSSSKIKVLDAKTLQVPEESKLSSLDYCAGRLKKMDVCHLKNLVHLNAKDNGLNELNISGNTKLLHPVALDGNAVKKLTVSRELDTEQKKAYKKLVAFYSGEIIYE